MQASQLRSVVTILAFAVSVILPTQGRAEQETIGDRLWIWAHAAGVYNDSYIRDQPHKSTIEPVAAADALGIRNLMMIRYDGEPAPPFDPYYRSFRKLDQVVWSLTGASGVTSAEERDHVFQLAHDEANITGFILDDFFHEGATSSDYDAPQWLAENEVKFPVLLTITPPKPIRLRSVEIAQSDWHSGDYRAKAFTLEASTDGRSFAEVSTTTLTNEPGASVRIPLPDKPIAAIRLRVLSSHDERGARSCGLSSVRFFDAAGRLAISDWQATASSAFPGHEAPGVLTDDPVPFKASITPTQLKAIRERALKSSRPLKIYCVVYTGQISPRASAHLAQVDHPVLWTWAPADLDHLEANLARLEALTPDKGILLGCYLYDFNESKPITVERMRYQTELGLKWLRQGRIEGIVFLGTPVCDIDLEAVEWTRQRIAQVADEPLPGQ